ncbi:MAG: EAL domain-containing protein [Alphaproteobacteria bacterium]|nr:EAL domain-containing protein [Alphaproteobacteria bacterium]
MVKSMNRQVFPAGTRIYSQGDSHRFAYLIEQGAVDVSSTGDDGKAAHRRLGVGDLLGGEALAGSGVRPAKATTIEDTHAIAIDRDRFQDRMQDADVLLRDVLRAALGNLHSGGAIDNSAEISAKQGTLESDLRRAILDEQLHLHFQPIVSLASGHVAGFEALVRWDHPHDGTVAPSAFVRLAEQSNMIAPLGRWMLRQALAGLQRFQSAGTAAHAKGQPLYVAVNVSSLQLLSASEVDDLAGIVRQSGVAPSQVVFEITETLMVENADDVAVAISRLREQGIRVASDDFGTGYANLAFLNRFRMDILKIDRSFITTMVADARSRKIVETIIALAKDFGMSIVAEGIEAKEEIAALRALECDFGQGYLFAKPLPVDRAVALVGKKIRW